MNTIELIMGTESQFEIDVCLAVQYGLYFFEIQNDWSIDSGSLKAPFQLQIHPLLKIQKRSQILMDWRWWEAEYADCYYITTSILTLHLVTIHTKASCLESSSSILLFVLQQTYVLLNFQRMFPRRQQLCSHLHLQEASTPCQIFLMITMQSNVSSPGNHSCFSHAAK